MSRRMRWIAGTGAAALAIVGGLAAWLVVASRQVPEFYTRALEIPPAEAQVRGEKFERTVLQLHNEVRNADQFQVTFTADEINGWLAGELPKKFPNALPGEVHDPRIGLEQDRVLAAFRYQQGAVSTVVTLGLEFRLTSSADLIAIRVHRLQAGAIPVPLAPLVEDISQRARQEGIAVQWQQEEGDPVALVPLRFDSPALKGKILILRSIAVRPEGVTIGGELKPEKKLEPPPETAPADPE